MARRPRFVARSPSPPVSTRRPPPVSTRRLTWQPWLLVCVGALAYANSLSGPLIFDDNLTITENIGIRRWWDLNAVLFPEREFPTAGRPLVNLSFALNYAVGGMDVTGYHLVNVVCHLLCGLLVFGIVRRTLELPTLQTRFGAAAPGLGLSAALLWTLHPLNTEAVNYITQRTELMMALFYLLTVYASIRAWASSSPWWPAFAVAACAAGMACKESMVTAPLVVILFDRVFVTGTWGRALGQRWRFYTMLAATWALLAAVTWSGPRIHSAGFATGVTPWTYLLNQTVIITRYLRLSIWPDALVITYGWPQALTVRDVAPFLIIVCSLGLATLVALVRAPAWGFLGAWFFITLAPASSIVPIATEVGAERRMYLPLVAVSVLVVMAASLVRQPRYLGAVVAVVSVALGAATIRRNAEYGSALVLARTAVERYPTSIGHQFYGAELLQAGHRDLGLAELRKAIPGAPASHYLLGGEMLRDGQVPEAISHLEQFLEERPLILEAVSARLMLGQAFIQQKRWPEALDELQMVLRMNPTETQRLEAHRHLAQALFGAERYDEAIAHCQEYLRSRPDEPSVLTRLAVSLVAVGRLPEAVAPFRRAAELDPNNPDAQRNLAFALADLEAVERGR